MFEEMEGEKLVGRPYFFQNSCCPTVNPIEPQAPESTDITSALHWGLWDSRYNLALISARYRGF